MCGVFGLIAGPRSGVDTSLLKSVARDIFLLSETRGKDASGAMVVSPDRIDVLKSAERVSHLVAQPQFESLLENGTKALDAGSSFVVAGHSRMVTNGSAANDSDNQPVVRGKNVVLHNGIIVNDAELWEKIPSFKRNFEVDTEVFAALVENNLALGECSVQSIQRAFCAIRGANTIATFRLDQDRVVIGTTNGSMYFWRAAEHALFVFASERGIVESAARRLRAFGDRIDVQHLVAGRCLVVNFEDAHFEQFALVQPKSAKVCSPSTRTRQLSQVSLPLVSRGPLQSFPNRLPEIERLMTSGAEHRRRLKRCTKCLLPETFPFIAFDADGVCGFCRSHRPRELKGAAALENLANAARRNTDMPDCLVPISGGRDSCYGLHYVKKELGLNPVAYTYDWGFVTDLARRNISRMCGSLGVEHVLIAADIRQKRENVRKNVSAWLQKPSLGMIPLFMAGDKMFFYYASMLRRQIGGGPILFSMNWLEKTGFKTGYAGIREGAADPGVEGKTYGLSAFNNVKLLSYYGQQFVKNAGYRNASIPDTLFAYFSYYLQSKDYDSIFDYLEWDQRLIERTIIEEYDWELSPDTTSTWRIGDGTAPFYNYIYLTVGGFSEHDTFRSNQIREGLITRDDALAAIETENMPRVESFKWYCDTIGIDAIDALNIINRIPKLYAC